MADLKINILFRFHEGAWGGGNQFLKALKKNSWKKESMKRIQEKQIVSSLILIIISWML